PKLLDGPYYAGCFRPLIRGVQPYFDISVEMFCRLCTLANKGECRSTQLHKSSARSFQIHLSDLIATIVSLMWCAYLYGHDRKERNPTLSSTVSFDCVRITATSIREVKRLHSLQQLR